MPMTAAEIEQTLQRARTMMSVLRARVEARGELGEFDALDDRGELSVLTTTSRRLEELMQQASELAAALDQRLARTDDRLSA